MKLKIGGHKYRVIYTDNEKRLCGDNRGLIDLETGTIYIHKNLIESERQAALLHEILHCINFEWGEEFVDGLARQLLQVLRDNKLYFGGK